MAKHHLYFAHTLPRRTRDDKIYSVLAQAREMLKRMGGMGVRNLEFKHTVEREKHTEIGVVVYITMVARFDQFDFLLPEETWRLIKQYEQKKLDKLAAEAQARNVIDTSPIITDLQPPPAEPPKILVTDGPMFSADPSMAH